MLGNVVGLYALLALVPFIIIYLIRPRSFERVIPSLMFIMQEKTQFKKASFLRKLLRNLLLLMQLLIIVALALSVAAPYFAVPHKVLLRHSVIVLDASASMATREGMTTRFGKAVSEARDHLGMKNTIILAENTPIIVLEDASSGEALDLLGKLDAKATSTNLGDALLLAGDLLESKVGAVTVISDFIATEGSDLLIAKVGLSEKGHSIKFVDVGGDANNVGVIGLMVDKKESVVEIKNFNDEEVELEASLVSNGKEMSKASLKLSGYSKEKITVDTLQGVSKVVLDVDDDLSLDNVAYISSPDKSVMDVLLITNYPDGNKIKAALNALGFNLEIREPPTVNAYNIDHDIVVIDGIKKDLFVPTDFVDLGKYVDKGGIVVMAAQEDLGDMDNHGLLPFTVAGLEEGGTTVCADLIGRIFPKDPFADEPCFTSSTKYLQGSADNDTITLVSAQLDNTPMLVHEQRGPGQVVYYGIIDKHSGFYSDPYYPVFWSNLMGYLLKTEDIRDYNHQSGKLILLNDEKVKTPSASLTTTKLLLDEAGIYEYGNKKVAVNLLNEMESAVNLDSFKIEDELKNLKAEKARDFDNIDFEVPLIVFALVLLFVEFLYIKRRGDL